MPLQASGAGSEMIRCDVKL